MEDKDQTVIVTCKANLTNMIFATKTKNMCESLRKSVVDSDGASDCIFGFWCAIASNLKIKFHI